MLVSKRGISMPAVRDDLADRAYRFQNKLGTRTLLNAVCTWDAAVTASSVCWKMRSMSTTHPA
ncbi:unnamed protein product [Scytosiphon promiscuus]